MSASTKATVCGLLLLTAACTVGPKYKTPTAPVPEAYKETGATATGDWKPSQPGDQISRGEWWTVFEDAKLNELEASVNVSNQNIAAAAANVQVARALIRQARAQYFPTATANPAITNSRISSVYGTPVGLNYTSYLLPLEASWEPDLWGRVRATVNANTFAAQSSAADLENVRLSAHADLAVNYFELRAQDALKRVLDDTIEAYEDSLDLTRARYGAGLDSDESVAQAEAQLHAVQAQDTNVGMLRAQYEHAIAVLEGEPPESVSIPVEAVKTNAPRIPPGVPSELLERRPDIASAERAMAEANARIGIARTAYFPTILLSASLGLESVSIAKWLTWPSRIWSVGPGLAQTLFDAGLRRATVEQYQAAYDQTVANYRQTVLTAFQQVEDNLAALRVVAQAIDQQTSAIRSATRALEEAESRYKAGIDPYLNVIAAQTALLNDQQAAVSFREQQMVASVQLIKALGGGWKAAVSSENACDPVVRHLLQARRAGSFFGSAASRLTQ